MNYKSILKKTLWCVAAISIVLTSTKTVYCTNYTSLEEYMQEHNKQVESTGYKTNNYPGTNGSKILGTTGSGDSTTATTESENTTTTPKTVKACEHTYTDSIVKEPTCAESGMMESKCSKCGDTYKTEIPATGKHEYSSEVTKEATCSEKGVITYTCSVCGDSYTEEIPMKEHTYESSIAEDATCTTAGTKVLICTGCGDSYTEEIPASGHVETEEITKEAGLFSGGEKVVKCSTCGEILSTEAIPSRFPIYYLYTGIAFIAVIAIAAFVLLFKATKNGVIKGKKIA